MERGETGKGKGRDGERGDVEGEMERGIRE